MKPNDVTHGILPSKLFQIDLLPVSWEESRSLQTGFHTIEVADFYYKVMNI